MLDSSTAQASVARKVVMNNDFKLFASTVPHIYEFSMALASFDEQALAEGIPKDKLPPRFASFHRKRRHEYLAGRYCASQALTIMSAHRQILIKDKILTVGENRVPVWPDGVRGSISHSDDLVGAVVGSAEQLLGVGLDFERLMTDERAQRLARRIATAKEWRKCQDLACENYPLGFWLTLTFSAKESLYKAIYPIHRQFVGFQEVELTDLNLSADKQGADGANVAKEGTFGYEFLTALKAPLPMTGAGVFRLVAHEGLPATMATAVSLPNGEGRVASAVPRCGSGL